MLTAKRTNVARSALNDRLPLQLHLILCHSWRTLGETLAKLTIVHLNFTQTASQTTRKMQLRCRSRSTGAVSHQRLGRATQLRCTAIAGHSQNVVEKVDALLDQTLISPSPAPSFTSHTLQRVVSCRPAGHCCSRAVSALRPLPWWRSPPCHRCVVAHAVPQSCIAAPLCRCMSCLRQEELALSVAACAVDYGRGCVQRLQGEDVHMQGDAGR